MKSRVLIAGGGGGAVFFLSGTEAPGGDAGAMIGGSGSFSQCDPKICISPDPYINATGGTNEKGGIGGYNIKYINKYRGGNGTLGKGGDGCESDTGSGGGGGYYSGGGGGIVNHRIGSGAGGSSYAYFPGEFYPQKNFYLQNVIIKGGSSNFVSPDGVLTTGNNGNGFIRISPFTIWLKTCQSKNFHFSIALCFIYVIIS